MHKMLDLNGSCSWV